MSKPDKNTQNDNSPYISPAELSARWRCARSSVARICGRARLKKLYLGEGKNGIVRYLRTEVEKLEQKRII
jgi:hypothetical protein